MNKGFWGLFSFGRTKDSDKFKLSDVLVDELKKIKGDDPAAIKVGIGRVYDSLEGMRDRNEYQALVGSVGQCFSHPVEALANEKDVREKIDELYVKCRALDAEDMKKVTETKDAEDGMEDEIDGDGKKTGKKVPKKKKEDEGTSTKDSAAVIAKAVSQALARVTDAVPAIVDAALSRRFGIVETPEQKAEREKTGRTTDAFQAAVDAAVRKQLGLPEGKAPAGDQRPEEGVHTTDSASLEDTAFILNDIFGQ